MFACIPGPVLASPTIESRWKVGKSGRARVWGVVYSHEPLKCLENHAIIITAHLFLLSFDFVDMSVTINVESSS